MLTISESSCAPISSFDQGASGCPATGAKRRLAGFDTAEHPSPRRAGQSHEILSCTVDVTPHQAVSRRGIAWRGMAAELVQATSSSPTEYRFRSPLLLLAAYDQGIRRDGESC